MISRWILLFAGVATAAVAAPVAVTWTEAEGLRRGGKPYFIKGAGGETRLEELAARGGNSIRTWGHDGLTTTLAEAEKHGLTVSAGIWLEHECEWFSYGNAAHCQKQLERVREIVRKHRDHPALLAWGLGNEMEGDGKNANLWKQVNRLAEMVKQEDPHHLTFTAVAGLSPEKAEGLTAHAPKLDFVGINTYGALFSMRESLRKMGWKRPFVVTEYGPRGFWEIRKTAWGAPWEQTSTEKAEMLLKAYPDAIGAGGQCLGGYAFLWGQKQEATSTWFGLFTPQGDATASVDALQVLWSGQKPDNAAPAIAKLESAAAGQKLKAGASFSVEVSASDPDEDPLEYHWQICGDELKRDAQGRELPAPVLSEKVSGAAKETFAAPTKPGRYRLMVFVRDGKRHAATANFPFLVE